MATWDLSKSRSRENFDQMIAGRILAGKSCLVEFVEPHRSEAQNNALHLWCELVAKCLNDSGLDMRRAIREDVDIAWSKSTVKDYLWRPIQKVMTGEESTTRPGKTQYPDIYETIVRHFAQKFGVTLPAWPTAEQDYDN